MAKSTIKNTAKVADTVRPAVAGAKERPLWHALRTVAGRITTPLLPDDYLTLLNPLWSSRELRGRVEEVIPETDDAATLVIRPGWGWRYQHRPGQFVGIDLSPTPRFDLLARSVDAYGERIEEPDQVLPALRRALAHVRDGQSAVLDVILARP